MSLARQTTCLRTKRLLRACICFSMPCIDALLPCTIPLYITVCNNPTFLYPGRGGGGGGECIIVQATVVSTLTSTLQECNSAYKIHSSNSQTKFLLYDSFIKGMRNSCHYTSTISTALFAPNSSSVFHPLQYCKCLRQHLKNNHSKNILLFIL